MRKRDWIEDDHQTPTDTTPMIDVIFQLLIFFLLTMNFVPDELQLRGLMPDQGQAPRHQPSPPPPQVVQIGILPAGLDEGRSAAEYQRIYQDRLDCSPTAFTDCTVRCGSQRLELAGCVDGERAQAEALQRIHRWIGTLLSDREMPEAVRKDQPPVEIHCYGGLPWRYALWIYDAVGAYESGRDPLAGNDPTRGRAVSFAAPELRGTQSMAQGRELFRLLHLR